MSAETLLLRDAAGLMRERARKATPGPWGVGNGHIVGSEMEQIGPGHIRYRHWIADLDDFSREESDYPNPAAPEGDAKHIASWHPAVALAVADWLDQEADHLEAHIPAWTRPSSGVDNPPGLCWNDPERLAEVVEHHYGRALAVARAYMGGVA